MRRQDHQQSKHQSDSGTLCRQTGRPVGTTPSVRVQRALSSVQHRAASRLGDDEAVVRHDVELVEQELVVRP